MNSHVKGALHSYALFSGLLFSVSSPLDGAGEGNRTLVVSLGSFCSAIELHPHGARLYDGSGSCSASAEVFEQCGELKAVWIVKRGVIKPLAVLNSPPFIDYGIVPPYNHGTQF